MNPATTALRDHVAEVLREAGNEWLSAEAVAARMRCFRLEVHSHLRALEGRTQARRSQRIASTTHGAPTASRAR
jgi:hypothetical protein